MKTLEIRKKVAAYMDCGFTMSEAFVNIKDAARKSRKTSKVADAIAASQQRAGTYEYGNFGKEYGNRKFGN